MPGGRINKANWSAGRKTFRQIDKEIDEFLAEESEAQRKIIKPATPARLKVLEESAKYREFIRKQRAALNLKEVST